MACKESFTSTCATQQNKNYNSGIIKESITEDQTLKFLSVQTKFLAFLKLCHKREHQYQ